MLKSLLGRSEFARHAVTLMAGTAISQALPILFAPVLSRLYTPSDFGVFASFVAITAVCAVVVTAKYEPAILLPATEGEAAPVAVLVILITTALSTLLLVGCIVLYVLSTYSLAEQAFTRWLHYVPPTVFLMGLYQVGYYWANRAQRYNTMAQTAMLQNAVMVILSILLSFCWNGPDGLLLGFLIGKGCGVAMLFVSGWRSHGNCFLGIHASHISASARRYCNFPKFSAPAALVNVMAGQMPVFLLTSFFPANVVGWYGLTQRVLGAPATLFGKTMGDVYRERANADFRRLGNCSRIYLKTFRALFLIALPMFLVLLLAAPCLFAWIFGADWIEAGRFAQIQSPLFFVGLIASPLSLTIYVSEKQKYDLMWQSSLLVVTTLGAGLGCLWRRPDLTIGLWSLSYIVMYMIYLAMSYHFARGTRGSLQNLHSEPDCIGSAVNERPLAL